MITARSLTPFVADLMLGPLRPGIGLGHGHIRFGSHVVSRTRPGEARMPNGIECEVEVQEGDVAFIGEGALRVEGTRVVGGVVWDPRPNPRFLLAASPSDIPRIDALLGRGPGLTPQGDDVLIGYAAASYLYENPATRRIDTFRRGTTSLSVTLLLLAATGALPEPAHLLLEHGDPGPLLSFGHSSGRAMLVGLALGCSLSPSRGTPPSRVMLFDHVEALPKTIVRIFPAPDRLGLSRPRAARCMGSAA